MRLKHKAAKYYDECGKRVELLPLLRELAAGEVLDVTLHYYSEPRKPASAKPLRICAIRKSHEQAERAKRKTRRKMRAPHKKPLDPDTIEMSEYFVVGTSLPADVFRLLKFLSSAGSGGRWRACVQTSEIHHAAGTASENRPGELPGLVIWQDALCSFELRNRR